MTKVSKNAFFSPFTMTQIRFEYQGIIFNEKRPKIFTNAYSQPDRKKAVLVFDDFLKIASIFCHALYFVFCVLYCINGEVVQKIAKMIWKVHNT